MISNFNQLKKLYQDNKFDILLSKKEAVYWLVKITKEGFKKSVPIFYQTKKSKFLFRLWKAQGCCSLNKEAQG